MKWLSNPDYCVLTQVHIRISMGLTDKIHVFQAELRGLSKGNHLRMEDMRDRAENLKSAREEKRKNVSFRISRAPGKMGF